MSSAKTKPITQFEPLKRLLFPTIKYDEEIAIVSAKQSPTINYEPSTQKSPSISWESLTPLEMVEKITSLVDRLDLSEKEENNSSVIDLSFLATPTPELNHLVNTDLSNSSFDDLVIPTKRNAKRRSKAKGKTASILGKRSFSDPDATHSSVICCNSNKREKRSFSRKEFAHHMSNWLKENWTNPYPDDDEVDNIAEETGMKIDEVVNWLINARTRRWRPSIEKACDLLRPAAVLKEDSINIYEGKPVRQIDSDSHGYVSSPETTTCASEIED